MRAALWLALCLQPPPVLSSASARQDPDPEWPKEVSKEWARPELVKAHSKFGGTARVQFIEKGKFVALHDTGGKVIVYEFSKWLDGSFLMTQALPCTGNPSYWRDYTGEVQRIGTGKHTWISNKERPVTVSPEGRTVCIARNDHAVQVWDVLKADAATKEFDAHSRGMIDLFFAGNALVTVAAQEVRVWNLAKLETKPKEAGFGNAIRRFALAKPDNRFVVLELGKYLHGLEPSTMKGADIAEDFSSGGGALDFSEDGKFFVAVTPAQTAAVYQSGTWKRVLSLDGDKKVAVAGLSPNGTYLAWADAKSLHLAHVATGFEVAAIESGIKIGTISWHPDGHTIYACPEGGGNIHVYGKKK